MKSKYLSHIPLLIIGMVILSAFNHQEPANATGYDTLEQSEQISLLSSRGLEQPRSPNDESQLSLADLQSTLQPAHTPVATKTPKPTPTPIPTPPPSDPNINHLLTGFGVLIVSVIILGIWINRHRVF